MNLTSKGQVTIPKKLRDRYGLREGVNVEFIDEGGALKIVKTSRKQNLFDRVYGILKKETRSTDELIEDLRGR